MCYSNCKYENYNGECTTSLHPKPMDANCTDVEEVFEQYITSQYEKETVVSEVDEAKGDWLYDGWEEDFDDDFEAYEETGRKEAENTVLSDLVKSAESHFDYELDTNGTVKLIQSLADHYELEL